MKETKTMVHVQHATAGGPPPVIKRIHQIFFSFDCSKLEDFPMFVRSNQAFKGMRGWQYKLWDKRAVEALCQETYPNLWEIYNSLKYDIQRVDLAKYMIADSCGGIVSDLDVIPMQHVYTIVGDQPYVFDRCSRAHVVANDFMYVGPDGLPNIFDYFRTNLARIDSIPVYRQRKMRYVFHTSGPDFMTRYIKRAGLLPYVSAISTRTFLDPKQRHRDVTHPSPKLHITHHLSWQAQVRGHV